MKYLNKLGILCLFCGSVCFGQMESYSYLRKLAPPTDLWHRVVLADTLFGKTRQDLHDIRVYGITASGDTIEAPYLLKEIADKITLKEIDFRLLNSTFNSTGYYFTFEIPTQEALNQLELEFGQQNFDWRVSLEGSQTQQTWFTLLEGYRILSIKNALTDFSFTTLRFPTAKYRYLRIRVESPQRLLLKKASLSLREKEEGIQLEHEVATAEITENKSAKRTQIEVNLPTKLRVSQIQIPVLSEWDYYRPITLQYVTDSVKTDKGWRYSYQTLTHGTLNSLEENIFSFPSTTLASIRILIENHDNEPLKFDVPKVFGYQYQLTTRFSKPATYYLTYGNTKAGRPRYDIARFESNIPPTLSELTLGEELEIAEQESESPNLLFENEAWLWALIVLIILLLGGFTLSMMRKK